MASLHIWRATLSYSREHRRVWAKAHKEKLKREQPEVYFQRKFKGHLSAYKVTLEWYELMLREQQGLCASCRRPETIKLRGKTKRLCVDHNHKTQFVRGLLCSGCNAALGLLDEDPLRIRALVEYLERTDG